MKCFRLLFLCLILSLTGCNSQFQQDACIETLQWADFYITQNCESAAELQEATDSINREIQRNNGDFSVKLTGFTALRKGNLNEYVSCQFIEFATSQQAQQYYDLTLHARSAFYRLSLQDRVVILTTSEEAIALLALPFE